MGCESDERDVQLAIDSGVGTLQPGSGMGSGSSSLDDEGSDAVQGQMPGAGTLGAACQDNAECETSLCVDGVCCDSPCTELCAACNLPGSNGTCSVARSDSLCPEANCPGQSTECRLLDGGEGAVNCDAVGVCRANAACVAVPAPSGTPCQQGTGTCDGQGACVVPDKSGLGAACAADSDCAEGHCVARGQDGARVCCDAACDGVCQACSADGRCEEMPTTDPRCAAVTCPADNVCRDYVDVISENLCRGFGQCRSGLDCTTPDYFTSLRPDAQCVCDPASGDCALASGTPCTLGSECASGACMPTSRGDQLCCSAACATGQFCSSTGTGCVQCEGTLVECDGNVQRTCNGGRVTTAQCPNGCTPGTGCNALPPVGFVCPGGQCAAGGVCQQDTGGQARCCVRNCAAEGKVCSPSGSCECPPGQVAAGNDCLLEPGDPCQTSAECQGGLTCVDGVCCREACGGYCERCQPGTGTCTAIPAGQQEADPVSDNDCTNGFECTGTRNGCKARTGQACSTTDGSDCVSGACMPTAGGGARICCSQICSGVRNSCRSTGQGCVQCESAAQCGNGCDTTQGICNPLRAPGATCTVAGQCSTNRCVPASDGTNLSRCCPNCATGQLCNASGQCVNRQSELGGNCGGTPDCRVGTCVAGVCCNTTCDLDCAVCSSNGLGCASTGACDAFDCIAPNPPAVASNVPVNAVFFNAAGTPPAARGGTIRDGRYTPTRIDIYAPQAAIRVQTYEFRARSVQIAEQDFISFSPLQGFLPEMRYAGRFSTNGTSLTFQALESCDPQFGQNLTTPSVQYTVTANGLITIAQQQLGTVVTSYLRQ